MRYKLWAFIALIMVLSFLTVREGVCGKIILPPPKADLQAHSIRVVDTIKQLEYSNVSPFFAPLGKDVLIICKVQNYGPQTVAPVMDVFIDGRKVFQAQGDPIGGNQSCEKKFTYRFQNSDRRKIEPHQIRLHVYPLSPAVDPNLKNNSIEKTVKVALFAPLRVETRYNDPFSGEIVNGLEVTITRDGDGLIMGSGFSTYTQNFPIYNENNTRLNQLYNITVKVPPAKVSQVLSSLEQGHLVSIPEEGLTQTFTYSPREPGGAAAPAR